MPNRDPQDGFFYPTLTLMIDSYNRHVCIKVADSTCSICLIQMMKWVVSNVSPNNCRACDIACGLKQFSAKSSIG